LIEGENTILEGVVELKSKAGLIVRLTPMVAELVLPTFFCELAKYSETRSSALPPALTLARSSLTDFEDRKSSL